jgi:hypothetical protein
LIEEIQKPMSKLKKHMNIGVEIDQIMGQIKEIQSLLVN